MKSTEMATKKPVRDMSLEELYVKRDQADNGNLLLGLGFLQEEIFRRNCEVQNGRMVTMTKQIRGLTIVVAFLTAIVTVATVALLLRE
jgi:hypothetical protein